MKVFEAQAITETQGKQFVKDQVDMCLARIYVLVKMAAETGKWHIDLIKDDLDKVTAVPADSEVRAIKSSAEHKFVYENLPITANLQFAKYNGRNDSHLTQIERTVIEELENNGFKCIINHKIIGHGTFEVKKYYLTVAWHRSPSDNLPHWSDDLS